MTTSPTNRRGPLALVFPSLGLSGLFAGAALVLLLQFVPPTNGISPIRRTISEYGLTSNKWVFDLAVLLVAFGSAAAFAGLIRQRLLPVRSMATALGGVWVASLLLIVAFPKRDWSVGPTAGSEVHRVASVVGFVALPLAVLFAARIVFVNAKAWRRISTGLALASLGWFGVILVGVGIMAAGGDPWWVIIPAGLVERGMALTGLFAVATLAVPLLTRPIPRLEPARAGHGGKIPN
ncbi:DUF998 domain-containing protein [Amycolatopsis minnesotensis]|uniref:DUF998 domain-containing protein n=1 Tax=Amycolatopsis minnesotensis TaxID=337894 RepID=A0ABP5CY79_9PSEU